MGYYANYVVKNDHTIKLETRDTHIYWGKYLNIIVNVKLISSAKMSESRRVFSSHTRNILPFRIAGLLDNKNSQEVKM